MAFVLRMVTLASSERATRAFEGTVAPVANGGVNVKARRTRESASAFVKTELRNSFAFVIYPVFGLSKQLFYRAGDFV